MFIQKKKKLRQDRSTEEHELGNVWVWDMPQLIPMPTQDKRLLLSLAIPVQAQAIFS